MLSHCDIKDLIIPERQGVNREELLLYRRAGTL